MRAELTQLAPQRALAQREEQSTAAALEACERELAAWQQRWEQHTSARGAAEQSAQVEQARIEQLEKQLRHLAAQSERLAAEHATLGAQDLDEQLAQASREEAEARGTRERVAAALEQAQQQVQQARAAQQAAEAQLEAARAAREAARAELTSLEALQAAALTDHAGQAGAWLAGAGLAARPRLAAALEVDGGWERAVETVLGDYLEAVCVEELEAAAGDLARLAAGRVTLIEARGAPQAGAAPNLAAHVHGPAGGAGAAGAGAHGRLAARGPRWPRRTCGAGSPSSRARASGSGATGCGSAAVPIRAPGYWSASTG